MFTLIPGFPDFQLCKPNVKFKSGNKILEQFFSKFKAYHWIPAIKFGLTLFEKLKLILFLSIYFRVWFNLNQELFSLFDATHFRGVRFSVSRPGPGCAQFVKNNFCFEIMKIWVFEKCLEKFVKSAYLLDEIETKMVSINTSPN